jgi:hypothetical protein
MAEFGVDTRLESLGDEVLQTLGFVMQLVQIKVEHAMKEGLDEAMMANDLQSAPTPRRRKDDAAVALVFDQWILRGGQFLQHVGDRGGRNLEALGQGA